MKVETNEVDGKCYLLIDDVIRWMHANGIDADVVKDLYALKVLKGDDTCGAV